MFNSAAVRAILEAAGNVQWVLSGHEHANHYGELNGIRYLTIADTELWGQSMLTIYSNYEIQVLGTGVMTSQPRR
jgi:UDP-2,3-diacylglucosamine pyrophosphatase LpxH